MESSAVVIKKYGNRSLYDTARKQSIRLATAAESGLPRSQGLRKAHEILWNHADKAVTRTFDVGYPFVPLDSAKRRFRGRSTRSTSTFLSAITTF